MLSRFTYFRTRLTPFAITSCWLAMYYSPFDEPFECATWVDSKRQRQWAKVVVGPTGCEKNAYGPCGPNAYPLLTGRPTPAIMPEPVRLHSPHPTAG